MSLTDSFESKLPGFFTSCLNSNFESIWRQDIFYNLSPFNHDHCFRILEHFHDIVLHKTRVSKSVEIIVMNFQVIFTVINILNSKTWATDFICAANAFG